MLRPSLAIAVTVAAVALASGCGGSGHSTTSAPTTTAASLAGTAACGELQLDVRFISQLISNNVEAMANSLHPKQLAHRTGVAQQSLLVAVRLVQRFQAPPPLAHARAQLIDGLRRYADDFGRARRSVQKNDMAAASAQLADRRALGEVKAATTAIDKVCGT